MKNQITFKGGLALMAMSFIFLASCKKEEITKKPIGQSENQEVKMPDYKFSAVAKVPGENPENGFLLLKVSSNNEAYLKKYVAKLEQTKIVMAEAPSTMEKEENIRPLVEEDSNATVGLSFDWKNFSFKREKGKLYEFKVADQTPSKSLVYYYGLSNVSQFNIGGTVAYVNVYSTYKYWDLSCLCYKRSNNCKWTFNNSQSNFFSETMTYENNLEVRTFRMGGIFSSFPSFTVGGYTTYYSARTNDVGPALTDGYTDYDAISSGFGSSLVDPFMPSGATLTFYIAG